MKLVVLSGAGISAESGIPTFRGNGGLWEGEKFEEVATPAAWQRNPEKVLRFYNERRKGVIRAAPNAGHLALVKLESRFDVQIITQNVDDLHERAGSRNILHLHGEIRKARSTADPRQVFPIPGDSLNLGDTCPLGSQLRPHIVWFCESVEAMPQAESICSTADILIITGTSLQVYPANQLVYCIPGHCRIFIVDPEYPEMEPHPFLIHHIPKTASTGLPELADILIEEFRE